MLTVACCLWGNWPTVGWSEEYVHRLKRGVERNLSIEHEFVCFTNHDIEGIETRPLRSPSWLGCLPKLYVYSVEAGLSGRILLFDLDNVITGPLDEMAVYEGDYCVRGRFRDLSVPDGDMIGFNAESCRDIWDAFAADPKKAEEWTEGRERWFVNHHRPHADLWQFVLPGHVTSFKNHCRKGLPKDARVVSFHGRPRPHEANADWLKEHWI